MVQCVHTHHQWDHGNGMLTCIQEFVNMNLTLLWNLLYDKLNYAQCWLALSYDQLEYRLIPQWITINNIFLFYHMKQIESMLLWVCTVIHNVCLFFCPYHILMSSVISYWTEAWKHGIYFLIWKSSSYVNTCHNFYSYPCPNHMGKVCIADWL